MENRVARVHLLDVPYHVDKLYDYYIPSELDGTLQVGGFAAVPFGGGNKKQLAIICGLVSASEYTHLKPIFAPVCGSIALNEEMLGLCLYMKEQFLCTVGDAVKAIVPSAALTRLKEYYTVVRSPEQGEVTPKQERVIGFISENGRVDAESVISELGHQAASYLPKLYSLGILSREAVFSESRTVRVESCELTEEYINSSADELISSVRGVKQKEALRVLSDFGRLTVSELRDEYDIPKTALKNLEEKGFISITSEDVMRDPYSKKIKPSTEKTVLSEEQEKAREQISSLCALREPKAVLLHGVTGSGKTSVIKAVMDDVIASGRSVIMLVPEISLTPQTVGIFRSYYGDRTVVVHSGLSKGERYDAWRKMTNGEADLCIGTRSAVFAPFKNLGLIVLDEEQEHTYKSDKDPKYHARDIARYRCAKQNAVMLLASATPSLDSYKKAKDGKYTLVELKKRYGNAVLPDTVITDMRTDALRGTLTPIGAEMRSRISEVLEKKEQAILFINQRGYNRFLSCPLCGHVLMCRHCSVSYTYHTIPKTDRGYLYCHYCGTKEAVPEKCPQCGNKVLRHVGFGTQMVEDELKKLFPEARIMRMDADTTKTKFSYDNLLGRFRDGEADIMIGTQMVTKGHDFPNVTLVGVISADASLYMNDYKANERTFGLLTQVIGRAGRGKKKGCALIQTNNPFHPTLRLSADQDYERMYESEIALRKSLVFPPYCDMVLFSLTSESEGELMSACAVLSELVKKINSEKYPDCTVVAFGPMEAPIYKIGEIFRMRLVLKCKMTSGTRKMISEIYSTFSKTMGSKIGISADVNPNNL